MKRIFTFLMILFFFSQQKGFSQDCVVLGCANSYPNQISNVGSLTDKPIPFTGLCFSPGEQYRQVFWQFFKSTGGFYKQTFTPTNSGDPLSINWAMFDMNMTPASTSLACNDVTTNSGSWTLIDCGSFFLPGTPQGPGDANHPAGTGTSAGSYYAVAVIIDQSAQASYSFDVGAPTLDAGSGDVALTSANCDLVLPVKLSSFNARVNNCTVNLDWTSETELNFKNYEVQSSSNGSDFKTIATLAPSQPGGVNQKYSYTDVKAGLGNIFYRLKMVDVDGKFDYSKTIAIKLDCNRTQFVVYPNPVTDILNVNIANTQNKPTIGKLFDNNGKLMYSNTLINGTNTINMTGFAKGIYILQLVNNEASQNIKIIR